MSLDDAMPPYEWIDGDPPPPAPNSRDGSRWSWVALAAMLREQPGRWVHVPVCRGSQVDRLRSYGCEVTQRYGGAYVRWQETP